MFLLAPMKAETKRNFVGTRRGALKLRLEEGLLSRRSPHTAVNSYNEKNKAKDAEGRLAVRGSHISKTPF